MVSRSLCAQAAEEGRPLDLQKMYVSITTREISSLPQILVSRRTFVHSYVCVQFVSTNTCAEAFFFSIAPHPRDIHTTKHPNSFFSLTMDSFTAWAFGEELHCLTSDKHIPFAYSFDRLQKLTMDRMFDPVWKIKRFLGIGQEGSSSAI